MSILTHAMVLLVLIVTAHDCFSQVRDLQSFFHQDVEFSKEQVADIRTGKAVAKAMPSRTPAEMFLIGAVYIHAAPESYVMLRHDFDRRETAGLSCSGGLQQSSTVVGPERLRV